MVPDDQPVGYQLAGVDETNKKGDESDAPAEKRSDWTVIDGNDCIAERYRQHETNHRPDNGQEYASQKSDPKSDKHGFPIDL